MIGMPFRRAIVLSVVAFCIAPVDATARDEHSIVGIYSTLGDARSRQGTGSIISESGTVLTAYHVIVGATAIRVFTYDRQRVDDVIVDTVYPDEDLALLKVPELAGRSYLRLSSARVSSNLEDDQRGVKVVGHPYGIPFQQYHGRLSGPRVYQDSRSFWRRGRQIFERNLSIIPLDITADRGSSGAPVIKDGQVIGVLSGSYYQGRGVAWAIPVEFLQTGMRRRGIGLRPASVSEWPRSTLMSDTWVGLEDYFGQDLDAVKSLALFETGIEDLQRVYLDSRVFAEASLPLAERAFRGLSSGITSSNVHRPADLDVFLEAVYALHDSLRDLSILADDYSRASSRIEESRRVLRDKVVLRLEKDQTIPDRDVVSALLGAINRSDESASSIHRQFIADTVVGLRQMAEGINHRDHLRSIQHKHRRSPNSAAARTEYDQEIREILELLRVSVTLIKSALAALTSEKFAVDSETQLRNLSRILEVGEIVIYAHL